MNLNTINCSANEALSIRLNVLNDLRDQLTSLSALADVLLDYDEKSTTYSNVDTEFMENWNRISRENGVSAAFSPDGGNTVSTITLKTTSALDIFQGQYIVDMFTIQATFGDRTFTLGTQNDHYTPINGNKGVFHHSTVKYFSNDAFSDVEAEEFLNYYGEQLGSIEILNTLGAAAVNASISVADVMSLVTSSGQNINDRLFGIISQYSTLLDDENACAVINLMISDYFYNSQGYAEEGDSLTFANSEYEFDSSCLIGWGTVTSLITGVVQAVAMIYNPVAGMAVSLLGSVVSTITEVIANTDGSVPKVVPGAAHNIMSSPIYQGVATYNYTSWAYKFIKSTGRVTITTEFWKAFLWVSGTSQISVEIFPLTIYDYNVVEQWRNGRQGSAPTGALSSLRGIMNFSTNTSSNSRSFQTQNFPDSLTGGSWLYPDILGSQSVPSELETPDQLYSRCFNGLFLFSVYVLAMTNGNSIHVVQSQSRDSIPSSGTAKDKLLWYVGAYLDSYAANFIESQLSSWLVPGWMATLAEVAASLSVTDVLSRFVNDYFYGTGTMPSIIRQDYGRSENVRTITSSTIVDKGSAMIIPPDSKYSVGQKLAVSAGIAATVAAVGFIASRKVRSIKARSAVNKRIEVQRALDAYTTDPSATNWQTYNKAVRGYNRAAKFNGASRISLGQAAASNSFILDQNSAIGETSSLSLASLAGNADSLTDILSVVTEQDTAISGLDDVVKDVNSSATEIKGTVSEISGSVEGLAELIKKLGKLIDSRSELS